MGGFQWLSETFLSKVFGKVTKTDKIHSVPGVRGSRLAKSPEDISFWDVIEEGAKPVFKCKNIIKKSLLYRDQDFFFGRNIQEFLRGKTLVWLDKEPNLVLPEKLRIDTRILQKINYQSALKVLLKWFYKVTELTGIFLTLLKHSIVEEPWLKPMKVLSPF